MAVEAVVQESEFVSLERRCGHGDPITGGSCAGRADVHSALAGHVGADGVRVRSRLEGGKDDNVGSRHLEAISLGYIFIPKNITAITISKRPHGCKPVAFIWAIGDSYVIAFFVSGVALEKITVLSRPASDRIRLRLWLNGRINKLCAYIHICSGHCETALVADSRRDGDGSLILLFYNNTLAADCITSIWLYRKSDGVIFKSLVLIRRDAAACHVIDINFKHLIKGCLYDNACSIRVDIKTIDELIAGPSLDCNFFAINAQQLETVVWIWFCGQRVAGCFVFSYFNLAIGVPCTIFTEIAAAEVFVSKRHFAGGQRGRIGPLTVCECGCGQQGQDKAEDQCCRH